MMHNALKALFLFTFVLTTSAAACGNRTSCMTEGLQKLSLGQCWTHACAMADLHEIGASSW